jgi:putative ABC transport system ATP-binding protein
MATQHMLSIRNLAKAYEGIATRRVLNNVSLEAKSGDCFAIMGDSGVGKSTLLNIVAGLDVPDHGSVAIEDVVITQLDETARTLFRRARMGFVFQAFHLLPHLNLGDNIGLPLVLNDVSPSNTQQRVAEVLSAVGLESRADSYPRDLSGGEMQRVAVARALVHKPALILADEPTGNLDADSATHILKLLRDQSKQCNSILLLVTHSHTAANTMDRVLRLTANGLTPVT